MTRLFDTGATRDTDDNKLDFEGFLSPDVLTRFAEYMHECRLKNVPPGQPVRSSDNWQKGIPKDAYMKSLLRHVMDVWKGYRRGFTDRKWFEDALCAIIFNVQGLLFELLKDKHDRSGGESCGIESRPVSEVSKESGFDPQV